MSTRADAVQSTDPSALEDRIRRSFLAGTALDLRPEQGAGVDDVGRRPHVRAEVLTEQLVAASRPDATAVPALRLSGVAVLGTLRLATAAVPYLIELTDCTFDSAPDLRMASVPGLRLAGCRLPGLRATNLRVRGDLLLGGAHVEGPIELDDAQLGGSLRLTGTTLHNPGGDALCGRGLTVDGSMRAPGLDATGRVRLQGARVRGNVNLQGAQLRNVEGDALDAAALQVGGSLTCSRQDGSPFRAEGRVLLARARIGGDAIFAGAELTAGPAVYRTLQMIFVDSPYVATVLHADNLEVRGKLALDDGFAATGTIRLRGAYVGGYLRLSGATLTATGEATMPVALVGDAMHIAGDLEARGRGEGPDRVEALRTEGQLRLTGAQVDGSASLSGVHLEGPGLDVLFADRVQVGGTLFLRGAVARGSVRLQNASIGFSLDCTDAILERPRYREDGSAKPSLDARSITVGKDLLCRGRLTAGGGVRLRDAEVSKTVSFDDATLGNDGKVALDLRALSCQELNLRLGHPAGGRVRLVGAQVGGLFDNAALWEGQHGLDLSGFVYQAMSAEPEVEERTRLRWLVAALPDFDADPYETLATAYREGGQDERAARVLLAKQRRRHAALGPTGRAWGRLQDVTVGYGYRPWLAACWLVVFWLAGALWFATHRPMPLSEGENPSWNPWLYAVDLLLPVLDFGHEGLWRADGASQWIASLLVAVGWIFATTVAAGVSHVLRRR